MNYGKLTKAMATAGWTSHAIIGWRRLDELEPALCATRTFKDYSMEVAAPSFHQEGAYPATLVYTDFRGADINDSIFVNPQQGLVLHIH